MADLLRRASAHPLGTDFLQRGSLDAVCAQFGVHAYVADAARDSLAPEAASAVEIATRVTARV